MPPSQSIDKPQRINHADALLSATLLATVGGLLDAVVYTLHGHVFANAVTGNIILFGISLFAQDWHQAARHAAPIVAFILGVAASRLLRALPPDHASLSVLVLEMAVLFIGGLLPRTFPEMAFTALIAFVSAFQVSTFRTLGRFTYNSTFVTGNTRDATEALVGYFLATDRKLRVSERAKAYKLTLICLLFLTGAMLGAWASPHLGNPTLWLAEPLLLIPAIRILRA